MAGRKDGFLTPTEYAAHAGVTKVAVHYAMRDGRITFVVDKRTGQKLIDPKKADVEWATNTRHEKRVNGQGKPSEDQPGFTAPHDTSGMPPIAVSRMASEALKAQLLKIERDQKMGRLIDAEEVKKEAFRLGRQVRDAMLNIPDRVSSELAAKLGIPGVDGSVVHKVMDAEIRKALEGLKNEN